MKHKKNKPSAFLKKIFSSLIQIPYWIGVAVIWLAKKLLKLGKKIVKFSKPFAKQALKKFNKLKPKQKVVFGTMTLILITVLGFGFNKNKQAGTPQQTTFKKNLIGKWDYSTPENQVGIKTKLSKNKSGLLVQVLRNKSQLEFALPLDNPTLVVTENKASYLNQDKSIEVTYEVQPDRLKESIILHQPSPQTNFTSNILLKNLVIKMSKQENLPVFFDTKNNYEFHLERPFAIDAAGNQTFAVSYSFRPRTSSLNKNPFEQSGFDQTTNSPANTISSQGNLLENSLEEITVETNQYDLIITVDQTWLKDPARQYPIIIDPTIVHDTTAEFATGEFNRLIDTGSGSAPVLETYYQELAADEHTVGLWHMNEGTDNTCSGGEDACDSSGNGYHGTATGTTIDTSGQKLGNASRTFGSGSHYLSVSSIDISNQSFTTEAWFKKDSAGYGYIIGQGSTGTNVSLHFGLRSTNVLTCAFYANDLDTPTLSIDTNWNHAACTYDAISNSRIIYLNGQIVASDTASADFQGTGTLYISGAGWSPGNFLGSIDEVRISNIARTPEEIKASASRRPYSVYTSPVVDFTDNVSSWTSFTWTEDGVSTGDGETVFSSTNLVAQWDFNETSGTTANNDAEGTSCGGTPANCDGTVTVATGGTITVDGLYTVHTFTSDGTFTSLSSMNVEVLVVAGGGGGGGSPHGGGAGGGGIYYNAALAVIAQGYTVTVGDGGAGYQGRLGSPWPSPGTNKGTNGGDSVFNGKTAIGGGGGGGYSGGGANDTAGQAGGSGGGGTDESAAGAGQQPGSTDGGFGYAGGTSTNNTFSKAGGGAGEIGDTDGDGYGGDGKAYSISGSSVTYAGGGGGSFYNTSDSISTTGGTGGGGNSGSQTVSPYNPGDGVANTGGGGGGAERSGSGDGRGGEGGTGVVIIRYLTTDAGAGSGDWTTTNQRWGAAALQFDGTNEYIDFGTNRFSPLLSGASEITLESWIKPSSFPGGTARDRIISIMSANGVTGASISLYADDQVEVGGRSATGDSFEVGRATIGNINDWHHVVGVIDFANDTIYVYIDGALKETASVTFANTTYVPGTPSSNNYDTLGSLGDSGDYYNGVMDSTRIYKRALTASEILSNYNSSNIQFQTRVGADSSPNDGSWGEWLPTTNEAQLDDFDSPLSKDLIAHWKLDEASGTRKDSRGSNDLADNATVTSGTGKVNNAGDFEFGNAEYLSIADNTDLSTGDIDFTVGGWINIESEAAAGGLRAIASKDTNGTTKEWVLFHWTDSDTFRFAVYDSGGTVIGNAGSTTNPNTSTWYHVMGVHDSVNSQIKIYVNGSLQDTKDLTGSVSDTSATFYIGANEAINTFDGLIDEFAFWKKALTTTEISNLYNSGRPSHYPDGTDFNNFAQSGGIFSQEETVILQEGTASEKLELGKLQVDADTVALWHLDETNGDNGGDDIFDETTNNNDGEFYGSAVTTGVIDGISGKARNFNGSDDYIDTGTDSSLDMGSGDLTIEAWIKPLGNTANPGSAAIAGKGTAGTNGKRYVLYANNTFSCGTASKFEVEIDDNTTKKIVCSTNTYNDDKWHYVVGVRDGNTLRLYIDGVQDGTAGITSYGSLDDAKEFNIGAIYSVSAADQSSFYNGAIDEVRVNSVARTAEEIAESYRMGRDHYLNKTISSADLSDDNQLAFDIAADRPGTYLEFTAGESAFANNQPDANTIGLWHLDEDTDDACEGGSSDACDASGNGNHGDVTSAPPIVQGKIGKARNFDGSADFITITDDSIYDFGSGNFSLSAWVKRDALGRGVIIGKSANGTGNRQFVFQFNSSDKLRISYFKATDSQIRLSSIPSITDLTDWHYVVGQRNGDSFEIYFDGVLVTTGTTSGTHGTMQSGTANVTIGKREYTGGAGVQYFAGSIDEPQISDIARSADQIRQAYERGLRTHSITIDFAAILDSGNLIADSSDTGFTVDATAYGLEQKGDAIYTGGKIIVRETIDATEYIAQGTVTAVTASTGAITVDSWDTGSTFPSGGYTANANVFKWQREYFDLSGPMGSHLNATTNLTFRVTNGHEGRTVWLDDMISAGDYLTTDTGSAILSALGNRYFQYRTIFSSSDEFVSSLLSAVTLDYEEDLTVVAGSPTACYLSESRLDDQIAIHWTDNSSDELSFEIEKKIDGGIWATLDLTSPDAQIYNDDSISSGYTYQYRVRNVAESSYGAWCTTSTVDLNTGSFKFEGLKIEGIRLD